MGRPALTISPDTNVLPRAAVEDDPTQTPAAQAALAGADVVALATVARCEFAWVLRSRYGQPPEAIAQSIRQLIAAPNVQIEQDGVIAHTGARPGGTTFLTFDREALNTAALLGMPAAAP